MSLQVYGEARFESYFKHKSHLINIQELNPWSTEISYNDNKFLRPDSSYCMELREKFHTFSAIYCEASEDWPKLTRSSLFLEYYKDCFNVLNFNSINNVTSSEVPEESLSDLVVFLVKILVISARYLIYCWGLLKFKNSNVICAHEADLRFYPLDC